MLNHFALRDDRRPRQGPALPRPILHALVGVSARGGEGRSDPQCAQYDVVHEAYYRPRSIIVVRVWGIDEPRRRAQHQPSEICRAGQSMTPPVRREENFLGGFGGIRQFEQQQGKEDSQARGGKKLFFHQSADEDVWRNCGGGSGRRRWRRRLAAGGDGRRRR